jgi:hypothetical protein
MRRIKYLYFILILLINLIFATLCAANEIKFIGTWNGKVQSRYDSYDISISFYMRDSKCLASMSSSFWLLDRSVIDGVIFNSDNLSLTFDTIDLLGEHQPINICFQVEQNRLVGNWTDDRGNGGLMAFVKENNGIKNIIKQSELSAQVVHK